MNWSYTPTCLCLILALTLSGGCCGCSDDTTPEYDPDRTKSDSDAGVGDMAGDAALDSVFPMEGLLDEIPDLSGIDLEEPSGLLVKFWIPSAQSSFAVTAGSMDPAAAPATLSVGGFVYGDCDSLYVISENDDDPTFLNEFCEGTGVRFFTSPKTLKLTPPKPDNLLMESQFTRIWVVAHKDDATVYDVADVVSNPSFDIPKRLQVVPDVLFAGHENDLLFTIDLNDVINFEANKVNLIETDASCNAKGGTGGLVKLMRDDGPDDEKKKTFDRLALDKTYTAKMHLVKATDGDFLQPGLRYFKVSVEFVVPPVKPEEPAKTLVAYSACTAVRVVPHIDPLDCSGAKSALKSARGMYDLGLASGLTGEEAKKLTVRHLHELSMVGEAGGTTTGDVVWVRFKSGILGAVTPSKPEFVGPTSLFSPAGGEAPKEAALPRSRQVTAATPPTSDGDPGPWHGLVESSTCPPLAVAGGSSALADLRNLAEAGFLFLVGRGGFAFGGLSDAARAEMGFATKELDQPPPAWLGWEHPGDQQIVFVEHDLNCDSLADDYKPCWIANDGKCQEGESSCPKHLDCLIMHYDDAYVPRGMLYDGAQADLAVGRLVLGSDNVALTPSFFAAHVRGGLQGQTAYLGFPFSMAAMPIAAEFLAAGADAVIGTQGNTDPASAEISGAKLLGEMIAGQTTVTEFLPSAGTSYGDHEWRFVGPGQVGVSYSGLINGDFGNGSLLGWQHTGEARVLASLCGEKPAVDDFMGLVSTGLESVDRGEISQEFCLPPDKLLFQAYYRYISHEFHMSCGSDAYGDRFEMYLEDLAGENKVNLVLTPSGQKVSLDALCDPSWGDCPQTDCGELFDATDGVDMVISEWPAECAFELEDNDSPAFVGDTNWRSTGEVPLTKLGAGAAQKPVRLVIFARDEGAKKGTTTVLVGGIELK